ncbi:GAF domain-containing sensor histidine kinase [Cyanobacteria bacterium FACHB-472]|nr:GAF domain-containing sensor histidine kinase [Cyanobacteria bacterium FACHB-472]
MPTSSEFVALCQSQVALLTQGLGAALSVVYLTEELVDGVPAKLRPIVAYPPTARSWETERALVAPSKGSMESIPRLREASRLMIAQESAHTPQKGADEGIVRSPDTDHAISGSSRQIVLPLIHEGVVMGFLLTAREDRPWNERERAAIERIAGTLAIACFLDQRSEWFEQQLSKQQRLGEQQRDLLDDLVHQFRNPLTALRTFGKLLVRRLRPGDANREVANSIVRESDRLQELLLQFDRAVAMNQEELEPSNTLPLASVPIAPSCPLPASHSLLPDSALTLESCLVAEVLSPLLVNAKAIASERNLTLLSKISPNLPPVQADAKALREVLSNLIDNALKYTPAGGQVYIQAGEPRSSPQGNFQAIAISDTGPGIPTQDREHLFERHYRGVQAESDIPGSGLGLAIARDLVQQMQGEIEIKSPAILSWASDSSPHTSRPGTTFIVWLLIANS